MGDLVESHHVRRPPVDDPDVNSIGPHHRAPATQPEGEKQNSRDQREECGHHQGSRHYECEQQEPEASVTSLIHWRRHSGGHHHRY